MTTSSLDRFLSKLPSNSEYLPEGTQTVQPTLKLTAHTHITYRSSDTVQRFKHFKKIVHTFLSDPNEREKNQRTEVKTQLPSRR